MIHYEIETEIPFKLHHCWEILKDRLKWQEIAIPKFSTGSGRSKRHKSSGCSSFNIDSGEASINMNPNVGDNDQDEVDGSRDDSSGERRTLSVFKDQNKGEHIIVAEAGNHPLMLEKSMYDSWVSHMHLFIKGKKHGRMMLDSIDNGPLVYPTVKENGQTRPKKYFELIEAQQLQDDCDVQAKNIILHGLSPDLYALVNHQEAAKDILD
uniref:No apical meristem-associated C-terminal domain-containing protein n=1 Tax=Tanacetum cinerariifolium TaxID=118510 RepID=A0A699GKB1_TANCI|nr:hypothetical protein [Tanacetum cinerariifolium]